MNPKEYWNKKIIEWELSSYRGASKGMSLVERIATRFRSPIRKRREILLGILKDAVKGKIVLELGCGTGGLCFEILKMGAKKVIGIDIAESAIDVAKNKALHMGLRDKLEFFVSDIRDGMCLPDADFTIGLGFIDYIDIESLKRFFAQIKGKFIFSFPEKRFSLINLLQYIYLKSQRCHTFYKFRQREFNYVPGMNGRCYFFKKDDMVFITNFEMSKGYITEDL